MTKIMANEIKAKMERGGFRVSEVHTAPQPYSEDGVIAEMIISDSNGQRFNISVYQLEDEEG